MSALLSRVSIIGIAKEATPNTYLAPTLYLPVTNPQPEDIITALKDTSIQANDTSLQGQYPGPLESTYGFDMAAYPVESGLLLAGILGTDTVTGGTAVTTTTSALIAVGDVTVHLTAAVPVNSTLVVDTGTAKEARQVLSITSLVATVDAPYVQGHTSGVAATTGTMHTIKQPGFPQGQPPSFSITDYENTDTRGYTGCKIEQLGIKIDPKGMLTFSPQFRGIGSSSQSQPTPTYTALEPMLGWQWKLTNGGTLSTRGLTCDLTLKRTCEAIASSDGTQQAREVFAGAFDVSGSVTVIFDAATDRDTFLNYTQTSNLGIHLSSPRTSAGISIFLSKPAAENFKVDRSGEDTYQKATFTVNGVYNTTDGGAMSAFVTNARTTVY